MIITHLHRFTEEQVPSKDIPWGDMTLSLDTCIQKGSSYMSTLHNMMQPYYEMYLFCDPKMCKNIPGQERLFMNRVIEADADFSVWASNQDIMAVTEGWGDYMKRTNNDHVDYYFQILECFIDGHFYQDWAIRAEELKNSLFQSEVYSDYKTDELFCILHGLSMIMQQEWSLVKKKDVFELLREHWGYMKHVYSIMIRHIVGCRLQNFAAVANAVMMSNSNCPHLDIFYCALTERMDSLGLDDKRYKKLDDARMKLLGIINRNKPSETLYELCDTIFPEEFQKMLEHRPKSYSEIVDESRQKDEIIRKLKRQTEESLNQIEKLTWQLKTAVEASIPIEDIERELMSLPTGMAWDIFLKLNELLQSHEIWRKYDRDIRHKLLNRMKGEEDRMHMMLDSVQEVAKKPTYEIVNGDKNIWEGDSKQFQIGLPKNADVPKLLKSMTE